MRPKTSIGILAMKASPMPNYAAVVPAGNELVVFSEGGIDWLTKRVHALVWDGTKWYRDFCPIPLSIYNRRYSHESKLITALERVIGKNKVFNHLTHLDKWEVYQLLQSSRLKEHLPKTLSFKPRELIAFLAEHTQVIVKPRLGNLGAKVFLVEQKGSEFPIYRGTKYPIVSLPSTKELVDEMANLATGNFLMQQYIPSAEIDGRVFDLRLLAQKNASGKWQITAGLCRLALKYAYVTNICHQVITAEEGIRLCPTAPKDTLAKLEELSLEVARALDVSLGHFGELSVDFGLDKQGHPWIIEVNGMPAKEMFADLNDPDLLHKIYAVPLAYAKFLSRR